MHIHQLQEGQEQRIERLHTRTLLRLYMPMTVKDALVVREHGLGSIHKHDPGGGLTRLKGFLVTHSLRFAITQGDIVLQFKDVAGHLDVPHEFDTREVHQQAKERYPESQMPMVSLFFLNPANPWVVYKGILGPERIDFYHLVGYDEDGSRMPRGKEVHESLTPYEFDSWVINSWNRRIRTGKPPRPRPRMMDLIRQTAPEVYD